MRLTTVVRLTLAALLLIGATGAAQDSSVSNLKFNLTNPPQPVPAGSASLIGNPGPRALYYWIVATSAVGNSTPAGPYIVTNAPVALSASQSVRITWAPAQGATSYDVLRTSTPTPPTAACNCAVATGVTTLSANDQSESLSAYTVNSYDAAAQAITLSNVGSSSGTALTCSGGSTTSSGACRFTGLVPGSIWGIKSADYFTGASTDAQVQAACNSFSGQVGIVVIPPYMAAGEITLGSIPTNCLIQDLRATNGYGYLGRSTTSAQFSQLTIKPYAVFANSTEVGPAASFAWARTGGVNVAGNKSNHSLWNATLLSTTPGQSLAVRIKGMCQSLGDCQPLTVSTEYYGGIPAGGDEGMAPVRVDGSIGTSGSPSPLLTATVGAINGSDVSLTGAGGNAALTGTQRVLMRSTVLYSAGTMSINTAAPPVMTGVGTLWATNLGGVGPKTNLFFVPDCLSSPEIFAVPITSVDSETQITLGLTVRGGAFQWWLTECNTGTYKIYRGTYVTEVKAFDTIAGTATLTVQDPSALSVGNAVVSPIRWDAYMQAAILFSGKLPWRQPINSALVNGSNLGTVPYYALLGFNGPLRYAGHFSSGSTLDLGGFKFDELASTAPAIWVDLGGTGITRFLQTKDFAGNSVFASFDRAVDSNAGAWKFGDNLTIALSGKIGMNNFAGDHQLYMQFVNAAAANFYGVGLVQPNAPCATCETLYGKVAGVQRWGFRTSDMYVANGYIFRGYSGNITGQTFSLDSSTGTITGQVQNATNTLQINGKLLASATAPTIGSGFGTSPSISGHNGSAAFEITIGTGGTASSGVVTLPAAANGWNCTCTDITTQSASVFLCKQTASSTTSATLTNYNTAAAATAWTAGDKLRVSCFAY